MLKSNFNPINQSLNQFNVPNYINPLNAQQSPFIVNQQNPFSFNLNSNTRENNPNNNLNTNNNNNNQGNYQTSNNEIENSNMFNTILFHMYSNSKSSNEYLMNTGKTR